jgi:hypothetical protein
MAASMVSPSRVSAEHRFFTGIALAILATVVVGFTRSFFLRPLFPEWPSPSETIFYVHGLVFTVWIVLLVAQASLVAGGRTELHRKIEYPGMARSRAVGNRATELAAQRTRACLLELPFEWRRLTTRSTGPRRRRFRAVRSRPVCLVR